MHTKQQCAGRGVAHYRLRDQRWTEQDGAGERESAHARDGRGLDYGERHGVD